MNRIQYAIVNKHNGARFARTFDYRKEAEAALTKMAIRFGHEVQQIEVRI